MGASVPAAAGLPRADQHLRATRVLAAATVACLMLAASAGGPATSRILVTDVDLLSGAPTTPAVVVARPASVRGGAARGDGASDSGPEGHPAFPVDDGAVTTMLVPSEATGVRGPLYPSDQAPARTSRVMGRGAASAAPAGPEQTVLAAPQARTRSTVVAAEPGPAETPPAATYPTSERHDPGEPPPSAPPQADLPQVPVAGTPPDATEGPSTEPALPASPDGPPAPPVDTDDSDQPHPAPPSSEAPVPPGRTPPPDPSPVETWLRTVAPAVQAVWAQRPTFTAPPAEAMDPVEAEPGPAAAATDPVTDAAPDGPTSPDVRTVAWTAGIWWAVTQECGVELPMSRHDCAVSTRLLLVELGLHRFDPADWGLDEPARNEAASRMAQALDRPVLRVPTRLPGWVVLEGSAPA